MGNGHSSVLPSELLAEFEPERILGKPDRAETWLVRRRRDGLPAIARIERCGPVNPRERSRFHDAYLTLRRLRHPGLPRLLQGGVTSMSGHYIVHEFVPGASLRNLRRNLDAAMVIEVVVQLIPVLYLLHHHRLTHQRVTPEKIIVEGLGPGCRVRLVDPPISTADDGRRWVAPPYRCPELDEDQLWDARSDLYGLSLSIFESVSGTHPFPTLRREGDSYLTVCRDVPPLSRVRADMPAALIDILQRMGSAYPAERPLTVLKLHSDLRRARLIARDRPALDLEALVSATRTPGLEPRGRDMVAQLPDGWQPAGVEADPAVADLADDLEARLRLRRSRRILKAEAGGGEPEHFGLRVVPVARGAGGEVRGPTESDPYYTVSVRPPDVDDLRRRLIRLCRGPLHQRRSLLLARWLRWRFEADEASIERFLLEHLTSDDEAAFLDWDRVGASILASLPVRWPRRFRNAWSDFPSGIPNRDVAVLRRYCMTAEAAEYLRRLYDSEGVSPSRALTLSRQDLAVAQHEEHAYLYVFAEKTRLQAARRIAGSLPGTAERILLRAARITQTPFAEMAEKYQLPLPKKFEDNPDPPDLLLHLARLIVHADEESRKGPLQARAVYDKTMESWVDRIHESNRGADLAMYTAALHRQQARTLAQSGRNSQAIDLVTQYRRRRNITSCALQLSLRTAECTALFGEGRGRESYRSALDACLMAKRDGNVQMLLKGVLNLRTTWVGHPSKQKELGLALISAEELNRVKTRMAIGWTPFDIDAHLGWMKGDLRSSGIHFLRHARRSLALGRLATAQIALTNSAMMFASNGDLALSASLIRRALQPRPTRSDALTALVSSLALTAGSLGHRDLAGVACRILKENMSQISEEAVRETAALLVAQDPDAPLLYNASEKDWVQKLLAGPVAGGVKEEPASVDNSSLSLCRVTISVERALWLARQADSGLVAMTDREFAEYFGGAQSLLRCGKPQVAARIAAATAWRCSQIGLLSQARDTLELAEKASRRIRLGGLDDSSRNWLADFTLVKRQSDVRTWLGNCEHMIQAIGESAIGGGDSAWAVIDGREAASIIGARARQLIETLIRVWPGLEHALIVTACGGQFVRVRAGFSGGVIVWRRSEHPIAHRREEWPSGRLRWRSAEGGAVTLCDVPGRWTRAVLATAHHVASDARECHLLEEQAMQLAQSVTEQSSEASGPVYSAAGSAHGGDRVSPADLCREPLIVRSPSLSRVMFTIERLAGQRVPIVLVGESGTGKELLARHAHDCSPMSTGNFVPVDCPSLSVGLAEAELFGHTKGAFSGAVADKPGLVFDADKGTLFLDEVGDLPLDIQAKLLRVLSTREVRQVGSNKARTAQFLLVSATNADLDVMVREGRFRLDLRHRLGVEVRVPPLRERKEEIMPLWEIFLAQALGGRNAVSEQGVRDLLEDHLWPGNIRELKALASACAALLDGARVTTKLIESLLKPEKGPPPVDTSHPFFGKPRLQEGLCFIRSRGTVSRRAYVAALRISSRTATRDLEEMVRAGVVLRVGTGRGCRYVMKQEKPG